jgi:protein TonB
MDLLDVNAPEVPGSGAPGEGPGGDGTGGNGKGPGDGTGPGIGDGPPGPGIGTGPIYVDGSVRRPVLLVKVQPDYPETARRAKLEGDVVVEAVISRDGSVEDVKLLRSTNPIFVAAAMDAVRHWRYSPATQNGMPVKVYFTVEVRFVLQ